MNKFAGSLFCVSFLCLNKNFYVMLENMDTIGYNKDAT